MENKRCQNGADVPISWETVHLGKLSFLYLFLSSLNVNNEINTKTRDFSKDLDINWFLFTMLAVENHNKKNAQKIMLSAHVNLPICIKSH